MIQEGSKISNRNRTTKSIDFYWEYNNYKFYASHKYIKESGGAQDNQYNDIKHFIENANKNSESFVKFLAICDGDYFNLTDAKFKNEKITKLESLKRLTTRSVFALTIYEIKDFLKERKYNLIQ